MKRFILVAIILFCAAIFSTPANAITLTDVYLIGTITDAVPSGESQEELYVSTLITMWNTSGPPSSGTIYDAGPPEIDEDWVIPSVPGSLVPSTLLDPQFPGAKITDPQGSYTYPYLYLYAKYGGGQTSGYAALYYLDELTAYSAPSESPVLTGGLGLSHITLFNPTREVPEGATLMLLGFGLAGVGMFRRFMKR